MTADHLDLTGPWRFMPDPYGEGRKAGYFRADFDVGGWPLVPVPTTFDACAASLAGYEGAGWFTRTIAVPAEWAGRRVVLRLEGVNYTAAVWVNGRPAGEHADGFLRFDLAVGELLRFGAENVVTVLADNTRRPDAVPGPRRGWRPYGGILREVFMFATDPAHIEHVTVTAEPAPAAAATGGHVRLEVHVRNLRGESIVAEVAADILDASGAVLASPVACPAALPAGQAAAVTAEADVPAAVAWSPDRPALYTARVALRAGGCVLATQDVRFGFRKIEAAKGRLLLNGRPIRLAGFNRHEDSPRTGPCPDMETVRRDLTRMKELGCNYVRLCHYPHHPAELDLCDELGLLVMGEIPLYWWAGAEEGADVSPRRLQAARRQLEAMIRRDANHPSVVMWSVSNETNEKHADVRDGNAELVALARRLDPTRLAVHVSSSWREHPSFPADDVVCINAYPSWFGRATPADPAYDLRKSQQYWTEGLARLHELYPGKPILVTEFGYPCLDGFVAGPLGEDMQARAIEAEFAALAAEYVCGATIWCWADHPWPEECFINYITRSPFGVVTRDRRDRKAVAVVRRLFARRGGAV